MATTTPYTSADMAELLGMHPASFNRAYKRLVASGMPPSLKPFGHKKFDRAMVDAWRRDPNKKQTAANDDTPGEPIDWHRAIALEYGPKETMR